MLAGMPSPFVQIDLLKNRKAARFASNKLDHVAQQLGVGAKVKHEDGRNAWLATLPPGEMRRQ